MDISGIELIKYKYRRNAIFQLILYLYVNIKLPLFIVIYSSQGLYLLSYIMYISMISNMTGTTYGAGSAHSSGAPEITCPISLDV